MIEIARPGVQYYADRIRSGEPFSFVKYADGELRLIIPGLSLNPNLLKTCYHPGCSELQYTFTHAWQDDNYIVGLFHLEWFRRDGRSLLDGVLEWLACNVPDLHWHDGAVWERALLAGTLYPIVRAIQEQPLPLVLIGPQCIADIGKVAHWDIAQHIVTHVSHAWLDRYAVLEQVAAIREPTFFILSAGPTAKFVIHKAWPWIGRQSFLIDFGSTWNAFTTPIRRFHNKLSQETLERCLTGMRENI